MDEELEIWAVTQAGSEFLLAELKSALTEDGKERMWFCCRDGAKPYRLPLTSPSPNQALRVWLCDHACSILVARGNELRIKRSEKAPEWKAKL